MNTEFENRLNKIEDALKGALNKKGGEKLNDDFKAWVKSSFGSLPSVVKSEHFNCLIEPNNRLVSLGGKRWRPLLMILVYEFVKSHHAETALDEDVVYSLTPLVEFVHTASLIHDDIEDDADLRRGHSAAHIKYGLDTALNAGSWLYFEAPVCIDNVPLSSISVEKKNLFYRLYTNELRRLHLGQAMDIYWHRTPSLYPTVEEYKAMVRCKTGTLASLASQIGAVAGGATEDEAKQIGDIAANIGIGFQIIDDVINLKTGNVGKKRGDDIVEGKKSLPVLIHVELSPEDKDDIAGCMQIASRDGIDSSAVEKCIAILESQGAVDKAAKEGANLIHTKCEELIKFYNDEIISPAGDLILELFDSMIPKDFK